MSIKEYKLKQILIFETGIDPLPTEKNGKTPWIKLGNTTDFSINFNSAEKIDSKRKKTLKPGDLLLCWSCSAGKSWIINEECYFSTAFYKCNIVKNDITFNKYLHFAFIKNEKKINNLAVGSVLKKANMNILYEFKIKLPDIKTQQQIIDIIEPFEKMLNKEKIYIDILNNCLIFISNYISTEDKIHFLSIVNFCGTKYRNQKKYIDTSNISKSIIKGYESIVDKRKSRANLTVENKSIIFSKLKGENKIYPIFEDVANEYVFSTGFENIKSDYNSFIYGIMLSNEFHQYKNSFCSGTVLEGVTRSSISKWIINNLDINKWDSRFDKLLELICLSNRKIKILDKIINLLLERYVI